MHLFLLILSFRSYCFPIQHLLILSCCSLIFYHQKRSIHNDRPLLLLHLHNSLCSQTQVSYCLILGFQGQVFHASEYFLSFHLCNFHRLSSLPQYMCLKHYISLSSRFFLFQQLVHPQDCHPSLVDIILQHQNC